MYQRTDTFLLALKRRINREFNHLSVLAFDELNVISVKRETSSTYERLVAFNKNEFRAIAREARAYALGLLDKRSRRQAEAKRFNEDDFVEAYLLLYNPVTRYLYGPETERKRLRIAEEMMTAKEYLDRKQYDDSLRRSANLWYTQSSQYAIGLEDKTCIETWKQGGVGQLQWVTQHDQRVCGDCDARDGKVYDIDKVPPKTHYNCRCYLIPYRGSAKSEKT